MVEPQSPQPPASPGGPVAPAGPAAKGPRALVLSGAILLTVGVLAGIGAVVAVASPMSEVMGAESFSVPGRTQVELQPGAHAVYLTEADGFPTVEVTGPGGSTLSMRRPTLPQNIQGQDGVPYAAVAEFDVATAGRHEVDVTKSNGRGKVGPSVLGASSTIAVAVLLLAMLLGAAGFILLILGLIRGSRAGRGPLPPGWPQPPGSPPLPGSAGPPIAPTGWTTPAPAPPQAPPPVAPPAPPVDPWDQANRRNPPG